MTSYAFTDVAGASLIFVPAQDQLVLPFAVPAAALRFATAGGDLLVTLGQDTVRLVGIGLGGSGLTAANLAVWDSSLLILDGPGNNLRTGSEDGDWIGADRGGNDRIAAGGGDDYIRVDAGLTDLDTIDGGAGTGDTMVLSGTVSAVLGPLTVTGIERVEIGAGTVYLVLDAATVATATPAAGAVFTIDASGQGVGSRVILDGRAVAAGGMALLAGAGDDSLTGGLGADSLVGGAGDDTIDGFGGGRHHLRRGGCRCAARWPGRRPVPVRCRWPAQQPARHARPGPGFRGCRPGGRRPHRPARRLGRSASA